MPKAYGMTPDTMLMGDTKDRSRILVEDMNNGDPNRSSQTEANYSDTRKGPSGHTCRDCVFYQSATDDLGTCVKVKGVIAAAGYSDYFTDLSGRPDNPKKASATGFDKEES